MDRPSDELALKLLHVSRSFGSIAAVADICLDVPRGEVVSLVGHSGCGKSTLLRLIAGVETVDGGQIFLEGGEVNGPQTFVEPEARNIGFVFQDYALFPHLTVRDNILFGLKRLSRQKAASYAADAIERVGVQHLVDRYPHTLSGGEQQRVALARALAPRPKIVLMDEPFSNLDHGLREKVRTETLALLKSLNTTVIMVTHDPQEALSSVDRVVLMRAGRIVQQGSPYDLHDRPNSAYAAEFFCAFNRIPGIYRDGTLKTPIGNFPQKLDLQPDSAATLFVRPQAITVSLEQGDLPARIEQRIFQGEVEQIILRVEGLDMPLKVRTMERLPDGTSEVRISVLADRVLAF
ncbi:MAG: ABC transporter ATP-binding protein [Proteobacteria bacterium]|jgi:iron(III) transport system ATP-binding protein|nr:MAG: ABC transporter ATP-binding protein [Pseudomonadota bacterium]